MSEQQGLKLPAEVMESLSINHQIPGTTSEMRRRGRVTLLNGGWSEEIAVGCSDVIGMVGVDGCGDVALMIGRERYVGWRERKDAANRSRAKQVRGGMNFRSAPNR